MNRGKVCEQILFSDFQCLQYFVAKELCVAVIVVVSNVDVGRCDRHFDVGSDIQK